MAANWIGTGATISFDGDTSIVQRSITTNTMEAPNGKCIIKNDELKLILNDRDYESIITIKKSHIRTMNTTISPNESNIIINIEALYDNIMKINSKEYIEKKEVDLKSMLQSKSEIDYIKNDIKNNIKNDNECDVYNLEIKIDNNMPVFGQTIYAQSEIASYSFEISIKYLEKIRDFMSRGNYGY